MSLHILLEPRQAFRVVATLGFTMLATGFLWLCPTASHAQTTQHPPTAPPQPPPTADHLKFFHYLLVELAGLDRNPELVRMTETALVHHFGLNQQELNAMRTAGFSFRAVLDDIRRSVQNILSAKTTPSPDDMKALAAVAARKDQAVASLAHQLLNSVRPQTAARLRAPGDQVRRLGGH